MLIITDTKTERKYKILRFNNIKKDDFYLTEEGILCKATDDYPDNYGSFILEEMDMITCHKCGKIVHVYDSLVDHAGDNSLYCSKECREY